MTCTLHVAWDEQLTDYHFGPGHPLAPVRVELTMQLAHQFGLWDQPGVTMAAPVPATDADLQLVHDPRYIAAVRAASRTPKHPGSTTPDQAQLQDASRFGLGTEDNPVFPGMHEASALVAGATLAAARAVWSGSAQHGASIAGGMHHAMAANASGFCVYNDAAIAITWLLDQGAERIAYVDIDAHHGDGVQTVFYADPRVLTIWGIVQALDASGLVVLADKGYTGEDHIRIRCRGRNKPASQKDANRAHARLRAPGERANAQLKSWRILRKLRCCPWRTGQLAKAIRLLQTREIAG
jgi:acetoin utilization protein AcuC